MVLILKTNIYKISKKYQLIKFILSNVYNKPTYILEKYTYIIIIL